MQQRRKIGEEILFVLLPCDEKRFAARLEFLSRLRDHILIKVFLLITHFLPASLVRRAAAEQQGWLVKAIETNIFFENFKVRQC